MTLDNEFFMLLGGGIVGILAMIFAVAWRLLTVRSDFFKELHDD